MPSLHCTPLWSKRLCFFHIGRHSELCSLPLFLIKTYHSLWSWTLWLSICVTRLEIWGFSCHVYICICAVSRCWTLNLCVFSVMHLHLQFRLLDFDMGEVFTWLFHPQNDLSPIALYIVRLLPVLEVEKCFVQHFAQLFKPFLPYVSQVMN